MNHIFFFFRRHLKNVNTNQRMQLKDNVQRSDAAQRTDAEKLGIAVSRVNADNIDENAWLVCNKVWMLLENPTNDNDDNQLNERLTNIQVN